MGAMFTIGEKKNRPGQYNRYEKNNGGITAGANDGVVAVPFKSNFGELGKVHTLSSIDEVYPLFGNGGANGTVQILKDIFNAGASVVKAVRLGTGGTKATVTLKDTTATPKDAVVITAKSEGDRAFKFTIGTALGDSTTKVLILYEDTTILEKIYFTAGGLEVDKLIAAGANSKYLTFTKSGTYTGGTDILATVATATSFTAGTSSTITNTDYSNAFTLLEPHRFNTIVVDSIDTSVHTLLSAFVERMFTTGKMAFAVIGEPTSVALATRQSHAAAFNTYKCIYVGGCYNSTAGVKYEGYRAAAVVAAIVAKVSSRDSITHYVIPGAVSVPEMLTNSQYEDCITNGMVTFSTSASGQVWIDCGITTLVTPSGDDDEGWKKIKRAKIRFEMLTRVNDTLEPLVGKIPNGPDGQTNVIEQGQKVLDAMITETKLYDGATFKLDESNPPQGDSAWYVITADDIDALEKIYTTFKFRFSNV